MFVKSISCYIGIPYKMGGISPEEGMDCWTFFCYVQKKIFDNAITLNCLPSEIQEYEKTIIKMGNYKKLEKVKTGCAMLYQNFIGRYHIGTYIDFFKPGILHSVSKAGSIFTPIERMNNLNFKGAFHVQ